VCRNAVHVEGSQPTEAPVSSVIQPSLRYLQFIRFSHTVFALPFALGSMWVAADGWPGWKLFVLILICMVLARTAAMTFNRLVDWEIDSRNPRTSKRQYLASKPTAIAVLAATSIAFIGTAFAVNTLCGMLAPVALAIVFFYSLTKRFSHFAQVFLGIALAVSPVGAWLAVTGAFAWEPIVLAAGVALWVAGFDMIYATQDYDFDLSEGLHSMVVLVGVKVAINLAVVFHLAAWICFLLFGVMLGLSAGYWIGLGLILIILWWEHSLARKGNAEAINSAFFKANALVGAVFLLSCLAGTL